ncbi:hypothetical protein MQ4_50 [Serratia phage MQ-4]|nr:hypothetical protein MQ4_50 [Serratia phage MQ-4]
MDEKTKKLREIMAAHNLTNKAVGEILGRSDQTVRIWSCANGGRVIPDALLELLALKVAANV